MTHSKTAFLALVLITLLTGCKGHNRHFIRDGVTALARGTPEEAEPAPVTTASKPRKFVPIEELEELPSCPDDEDAPEPDDEEEIAAITSATAYYARPAYVERTPLLDDGLLRYPQFYTKKSELLRRKNLKLEAVLAKAKPTSKEAKALKKEIAENDVLHKKSESYLKQLKAKPGARKPGPVKGAENDDLLRQIYERCATNEFLRDTVHSQREKIKEIGSLPAFPKPGMKKRFIRKATEQIALLEQLLRSLKEKASTIEKQRLAIDKFVEAEGSTIGLRSAVLSRVARSQLDTSLATWKSNISFYTAKLKSYKEALKAAKR